MTDLRKAAEMAWNYFRNADDITVEGKQVMEALRQALAQPEQEPVAWMLGNNFYKVKQCNLFGQNQGKEKPNQIPLYTAPPKREWVGLTDEEINLIYAQPQTHAGQYAKAIEAKLKEKNT